MFNVLKKMLRRELGNERYDVYAKSIKRNIREAKRDNSAIFNDIYAMLQERGQKELSAMQANLNVSLVSAFHIGKSYFGVVVVYLVAFCILAGYAIRMVAVPAMIFISILFLVKTYEFLVNKFCYIDVHLVLIYKAALERTLREQSQKEKLSG